jgi:sugar phosphate isomerase/epimerase
MKLGFVTAILPELSFDNVLNFARHEGFSTVEVMCWPVGKAERKYAGVTHIDVIGLTKTKAHDILGQCQDQGVSISALGYYPNMLDPEPRSLALRRFALQESHRRRSEARLEARHRLRRPRLDQIRR